MIVFEESADSWSTIIIFLERIEELITCLKFIFNTFFLKKKTDWLY